MVSTAVTAVLQDPGLEEVVERILAGLDWRSILSAGMTCSNLNNIVTGSSRLQLPLRVAYYGFPSSYTDFDRPMDADTFPSPAERIERLLSVQRNWIELSPCRLETVDGLPFMHVATTSGLLIRAVSEASFKRFDLGSHIPVNDRKHERCVAWIVSDTYALRDPEAKLSSYAVISPVPFDHCAASREDNIVALGQSSWDGSSVHVQLTFALLETNTHPSNGSSMYAVPHPGAVPIRYVERERDFRELFMTMPEGAPLPTSEMRLGPDSSVMVSIDHWQSIRIWNWRTGEERLGFFPNPVEFPLGAFLPLDNDNMLCLGLPKSESHSSETVTNNNASLVLLQNSSQQSTLSTQQSTPPAQQSTPSAPKSTKAARKARKKAAQKSRKSATKLAWFDFTLENQVQPNGVMLGSLRLPKIDLSYRSGDWVMASDRDLKLLGIDLYFRDCQAPESGPSISTSVVLPVAHINQMFETTQATAVIQNRTLGQLGNAADISVGKGHVVSAVSGLRVVLLERGGIESDNVIQHDLHLTDYAFTSEADRIHTSPLGGCSPAHVPPIPRPREQSSVVGQFDHVTPSWDSTKEPGQHYHSLMPSYTIQESGYRRTAAILALARPADFIDIMSADAEHLYIHFGKPQGDRIVIVCF